MKAGFVEKSLSHKIPINRKARKEITIKKLNCQARERA